MDSIAKRSICFRLLFVLALCFGAADAYSTTYYFDCNGDDSGFGTTPATAWKTLKRGRNATFVAGDVIYFKRGCTWVTSSDEYFMLNNESGDFDNFITIQDYGLGTDAKPLIQALTQENIVFYRSSYIRIRNIDVTSISNSVDPGCGNCRTGKEIGLRIRGEIAQPSHHIEVSNCYFEGLTRGVSIDPGSHHVKVDHCTFYNNNLMEVLDNNGPGANNDAGAHGIVIYGDDNEVSYCTIDGSAACSYDFVFDGSAVEIFGGSRNFVHHNLARQNVTFTELGGQDIVPHDNVFAFNIVTSTLPISNFVVTRGGGTGSAWGPVNGTKVYNNTVFLSGSYPLKQTLNVALVCSYGCDETILTFKNNIIVAFNRIEATDQRTANESNNIYWDGTGLFQNNWLTWTTLGINSGKLDPKLTDIYAGDFTPLSTSQAIGRGTAVSEVLALGLTTDFAGNALLASGNIDIGAIQFPIPGSFSVDAGTDQLLRLPNSSTLLEGTTGSAYTDYTWQQMDGPTQSTVTKTSGLKATVSNLFKGEYRFRVSIASPPTAEAFDEMIVRVVENQQPVAQAGPDINILHPSGQLAIQGVGMDPDGSIISFWWRQVQGIGGVMLSDPSMSLLRIDDRELGTYEFELTVTDNEGLTGTDRMLVVVDPEKLNSNGIPLLFSPNKDGVHDLWVWQAVEQFDACTLKVFDQFGRKVFEATPYQNNWDGTYQGAPLEESAYFYILSCESDIISGGVRIIR